MAANPITEEALEAYCRRRLVDLSVWEGDLLIRLDDAVLAIWAQQAKAPAKGQEMTEEIPVTDTAGVRGIFQRTGKLVQAVDGQGSRL